MYVKRSLRALRWISIGGAVEPFCHTYFWNTYSDVCRPGFLSNMWSLGQIEHCMLSYNNIYSHGETSKFDRTPRTRPSHENSRSSQFNITKAFRLDWTKYYVDVIKFVGGVSYRLKHVTSCCQQVVLLPITEYGHVDLFISGVLSNMWSWCRSDIACLSYNNFLFHGETIEIWEDATDTPSDENSRSSQFNVTKGLDCNDQFWCSSD